MALFVRAIRYPALQAGVYHGNNIREGDARLRHIGGNYDITCAGAKVEELLLFP